jgi:hypothetical protein
MQKSNVACIDVSMWEIAQGPHFDDLQRLLESFWIPDTTSTDNFLLQYDLIIVPDPVLAKVRFSGLSSSCNDNTYRIIFQYLVEAYYEKEAKVEKKKSYYNKLVKQPWGVIDAYPPKERLEWEKIKNLSKQKWIRKFPPIAVLGEDSFNRLKNNAQVNKPTICPALLTTRL